MATAEEVFRGAEEVEACLYTLEKRVQQCFAATKGAQRRAHSLGAS